MNDNDIGVICSIANKLSELKAFSNEIKKYNSDDIKTILEAYNIVSKKEDDFLFK